MSDTPNQQILLMLGELKGTVEKGFENMEQRFREGDDRIKGHDTRIKVVELWQATATGKVAMIGTAFSLVAAFVGNMIIKAFIQPQ